MLISPTATVDGLLHLSTLIARLLGAALFCFYLQYALSLSPWTRGIAQRILVATQSAVIDVPLGIHHYLRSLLNIALIVVLARFGLGAVRAVFRQISLGQTRVLHGEIQDARRSILPDKQPPKKCAAPGLTFFQTLTIRSGVGSLSAGAPGA